MSRARSPLRALFWSAAAASVIASASLARQQDVAAATNESSSTDDIIVTAQRRSEKLQDVPISITAISGEALAAANINGIQGLEKISVGKQLSRTGVYLKPTIRGISTSVVGIGQENKIGRAHV